MLLLDVKTRKIVKEDGLATYEDMLKRSRAPSGTFPESWLLDRSL